MVTGTCFAEAGNDVICVDIDEAKVAKMKRGEVPIYEPGLDTIFARNITEDRLAFTTNLAEAVKKAEVIFLALPTPPNDDGSADLSYVMGVAGQLGKLLDHYCVVVDKSTVPVGTADKVVEAINANANAKIDVVSNPEFLREGFAVNDFMKPDRVVIGTASAKARAVMKKLYDSFVNDPSQIIFMDERSAEMTKYAANSFLATKISFMNEIANLCERVGANVDAVRLGIGADDRIGRKFLFAGIGYGGSCFPKDVVALHNIALENDYDFKIMQAVGEVNKSQKLTLTNKIKTYYDGKLKDKRFALWGLAFKPDTDDIREAPALTIIDQLVKDGASIVAYDPEATENVRRLYGGAKSLSFAKDMYEALDGADSLLIATEWSEFHSPDFGKMKRLLKTPVIFDGRNVYEPEEMNKLGFYYESVGRAAVSGKGGKK